MIGSVLFSRGGKPAHLGGWRVATEGLGFAPPTQGIDFIYTLRFYNEDCFEHLVLSQEREWTNPKP